MNVKPLEASNKRIYGGGEPPVVVRRRVGYAEVMRFLQATALPVALGLLLAGCATRVAPAASELKGNETIAFGRIAARLTAATTRAYIPEVRFFELIRHETGERFRVDVQAADAPLVLTLPPGTYELGRIMISEGGFQAMADLGPTFHVGADTVTYIGTWTFGIAAPTYDREIALTVSDELGQAREKLSSSYPALSARSITSALPSPQKSVTRLHETDPYPLIWWFRRHHTT